jgi:uncharacterized protein YbbC (DUF1343 family)
MFETTGSPWVMPSPNMPSPATALVYPGMCLLEGTNVSEGRGTTRPFEMFGASWIDGWELCRSLQRSELPGVYFRPIQFLPTFHKFQNEICEGAFIHVTDPENFNPVMVTVAILKDIVKKYPGNFRWKEPPYEYEYEKLPIDILAGNSWLREMIDADKSLSEIEQLMQSELDRFEPIRQKYLIYR